MHPFKEDIKSLFSVFSIYIKHKITYFASIFEHFKNFSVEILMIKRGKMQTRVWHGSMVTLASVGLLTSGVIGGRSLVSSAYPGIGGPDPRFIDSFEPFPEGEVLDVVLDPNTVVSQKPRSEVVEYEVGSGDTLSSVAKKFGISTDTLKWANDLKNENQLQTGDILKILPVTGVAHKVKSGETLESIAKKYKAEAQGIVDFPFNGVPDDFKLKAGQSLVVPDGVIEQAAPVRRSQPQFIAQGPSSPVFNALGGGKFVWPTAGGITQYYAWYHPGIDIPNKSAPGISAADGGVVAVAGWPDNMGYGNRIVIDHGNGYKSLYAHLSNVYVSSGQNVSRGQIIGQMGSTGRSTGTHLHFEIHYKGVPVNPLAILK